MQELLYFYNMVENTSVSFATLFFSARSWRMIAYNFLVWLVPGLVVFVIYLFIIGISVLVGDGSMLAIEAKLPKGILAFMAIALIATSIFSVVIIILYSLDDLSGILYLSLFSLICLVAGIVFLNKELKRLYQLK